MTDTRPRAELAPAAARRERVDPAVGVRHQPRRGRSSARRRISSRRSTASTRSRTATSMPPRSFARGSARPPWTAIACAPYSARCSAASAPSRRNGLAGDAWLEVAQTIPRSSKLHDPGQAGTSSPACGTSVRGSGSCAFTASASPQRAGHRYRAGSPCPRGARPAVPARATHAARDCPSAAVRARHWRRASPRHPRARCSSWPSLDCPDEVADAGPRISATPADSASGRFAARGCGAVAS